MNRRRALFAAGAGAGALSVAGVSALMAGVFDARRDAAGGPDAATTSDGAINIGWADLIPNGDQMSPEALQAFQIVEHGDRWAPRASVELVTRYIGERVRLPGYMVPLEFEPDGVRHFLLVPFVGACIHVPPPPANQIVLVTSETPYPAQDYFDAVYVTGTMDELGADLELAEVGYLIEADDVSAYQ